MPVTKTLTVTKDFDSIGVSLASAETILSRSHGEVLTPETINYRTFKPEMDGLFCEKIFGPVKDYECHCGKYKRIRYKGIICDRCGVEVTRKAVRRERMGHITLTVPVVHIWYFKSLPNKIAYLLGMSSKNLDKIVYYETFVVINPGVARDLGYAQGDMISEEEKWDILEQLPEDNQELDDDDDDKFIVKEGADALEALLGDLDLDDLAYNLRYEVKHETSQMRKKKKLKRLQVIESFRAANQHTENRPEWMVQSVIPVIPPELRPLVPLEGGRFATSDLNDLYRRVIIRNNRLKRLIDIKAPDVILRNEKRMLQEAVDSLYDNSRKSNAVRNNNRPLKSLSDMLKGKSGRFRQNLLGKRVDYSGRSVIVVGPELKMHECGLPKEMAVELYKPFIIRRLIERGYVKTVKSAKKVVDRRDAVVWEVLENVIDGHPVLLNRAPTLHRLGIQAFQPVLIEEKAIRLHPLACTAFNADFDGDQMAVHLPLSHDAVLEASVLMLGSHNILSPANGGPIAVPSQDMILGLYYLTKPNDGMKGEGKTFASPAEVLVAFDQGKIDTHAKINVRIPTVNEDGEVVHEVIKTSTGRVLFNQITPKEIPFINKTLGKKELRNLIGDIHAIVGTAKTSRFLDDMKKLGYEEATIGGLSFSLDDIIIPDAKGELITKAKDEVTDIQGRYEMGFITDNERYNQVIDKWTSTTNRVSETLFSALASDRNGFNPVYMMADSGARGSKEQIRQLGGMRGLMAKPQKSSMQQGNEVIENPILSSFKEGLTVLEYFISTHGARKGLADTALKTADAGYLTRRLVDVSQDVIINENDCGTLRGIKMAALKDNEDIIESLEDRIIGRVSLHEIYDPISDELICEANQMIDESVASKIAETSIEEVEIRSVLTCETGRGVCAKCYGRDLARGTVVEKGEAVGVIAAQSIGEPGTQLTLRTFHVGGTASRLEAESQHKTKFEGKVEFENVRVVVYNDGEEEHNVVLSRAGEIKIVNDEGKVLINYNVPYGSEMLVEEGDVVPKGAVLCKWDPYNALIFSEIDGTVEYKDIIDGVTSSEDTDAQTGHREKVITDSKDRSLVPTLVIKGTKDRIRENTLPVDTHIVIDDGAKVEAGQVIAKIPRATSKSKDITAGLPRVTELFEARSPSEPAVVSEIDGIVEMGGRKRGSQEVFVKSKDGTDEKKYLISLSKHILVQSNDFVKAGQPLSDGTIPAQDILNILGPYAVQSYLVNEIQEVYRLQGVKINDKHIEVIVRTMMQKVEITDPGDTMFLEGDKVDRFEVNIKNDELIGKFVVTNPGGSDLKKGAILDRREVRDVNNELIKEGVEELETREAEPAISKPILLGITRAALSTDSWLSAASFQETTKVLTQASIEAKKDFLRGLKENVVVGHKVPAGTGLRDYNDIVVGSKKDMEEGDEEIAKVFEELGGSENGESETAEAED
ncbi:MAG: DNA-directed RNA polymerase subunit beta' [Gracilimonas sp.]|uniref:DNA-directed RNA polymerase subunit beta' n=1 Tax=Gracilimonas sediminicola TaxID=2952158 RepID=A0A9X2L3T7_9BACT|nr:MULTISPECIES: DNA-directed RNA polymerase subunit beta' [Gracilimonas]MBO6585278.1 DNA-directed RNA polymerase subunit beta' [Gracilimonas sp.]MBO6616274.1 DNA-directed RNA polymerase subunit beta' [Gracilimonas sp.]MCP9291725.1 DNA-directed RNA polymerase subunit beta' [Gracilimonas sediminicola]